jgi:phenylalanine-4-hydroxylase
MDESVFTKQYYSKYTEEDKEVWKTLFNKQWDFLNSTMVASRWFYDGVNELKLNGNEIPKFSEVNKILSKKSWKIKAVNGIVDDGDFFECLRTKVFPVTTWIRTKENIDYLEEPDMFHDLFGHVPFLVHQTFLNFLERLGNHAKPIFESKDKERQYQMSRFYWYTIEFGLIKRKPNVFDIYGAGILSSNEETKKVMSSESEKKPFKHEILAERFTKSELQSFYAYINRDIKFINKLELNKI